MSNGHTREVKRIIQALERQGWRAQPTGSGHWKLYPPDPDTPFVVIAASPSDHRAIKNITARLRRAGAHL